MIPLLLLLGVILVIEVAPQASFVEMPMAHI